MIPVYPGCFVFVALLVEFGWSVSKGRKPHEVLFSFAEGKNVVMSHDVTRHNDESVGG